MTVVAERHVGRAVPRREDERILRGQARYLDDLELPNLAHAAFVRSAHAYARIASIAKPDGALLVLTAADLEGRVRDLPVQGVEGAQLADAAHPVLARDEVRYVGQPVAVVVGESRALAEDAAELVAVDYEPLEPALDPRTAPETLLRWSAKVGNAEEVFAAAAHTVSLSHTIPRLAASPMETRGAIAGYDSGADLLTVHVSAQDPHRQLSGLSHVLHRDDDRIRVIVPDVGGAFGSKGAVAPETCAVAVAAMELGRPVKWAEDRAENLAAAYQGRGLEADVELALDDDGRILAVRARLYADLGGYLFPTTAVPAHTAAKLLGGCYTIRAADVEVVGARTNKVPTGPYRGAGRPEGALLLERTVDEAARAAGFDRIELRRRNLIPRDAFPYESALGWTYDSGDYERCLDTALELLGDPPPDRGVGVAMYVERAGGLWESARVTVQPSGRVVVATGSTPHGQGHETTFAQIVADELGVAPEDVVFHHGDSAVVPRGVGTFGSRSAAVGGSAVLNACRELRAMVERHGGTLREAATALAPLEVTARYESALLFGSGCYAAVVHVDAETGKLTVERVVAVDDAGTILNPLLAEGQVLGGIAQAVGECVCEEVVYDESGQLRTASYADYSLPTAAEMPHVDAAFVETPTPYNPLGAKGIGEGGTIGALAAIANAVADAVGGHVDPPYTEEKLWRALRENRHEPTRRSS